MPDTTPSITEALITTRSKGRATESGSSEKTEPTRLLHFVLQGKGGVGKTMTALLLAQCIADKGEPVICADTDPVNASLSSLSPLPTEQVSIFNGNRVDTRALDEFTERMVTEDSHFVIDNGASSFVPISHYLLENDVSALLAEEGRLPVIHVVVTGGPGMLDTMKGLSSVLADFPPTVRVVVWVNQFFGPVINANGKKFHEMPIYLEHKDRIFASINLPPLSDEASSDVREMISKRISFADALKRDNSSMLRMQKSRLFKLREALWPQIQQVI
jgi:hypothetical protein